MRQVSGLWAESPAIRWWRQMRDELAPLAWRTKPFNIDAKAPSARRVAAILAAGALLIIGVYTLRPRGGTTAAIEPASLPKDAQPGGPIHPAHAGQAGSDAQPPRADAARPYPRPYFVLLSRSIFAVNGAASRRSQASAASPPGPAPVPLAFSLKGITQEDTYFTAFVEDTSAKKFFQLRLGDPIGPGRVCDITLHDLTYEISGNRLRLEIDNVSGQSGPAPVIKTRNDNDGGAKAQDTSPPKKKKNHSS